MDGETSPKRVKLIEAAPIRLGGLIIEPAQRTVRDDHGRSIKLEPRVMQVLVALSQSPNEIHSRDELVSVCWNDVAVSDDAVNRVISLLRRQLSEFPGAEVSIETITKVGYRLLVNGAPTSAVRPASLFKSRNVRHFAVIAAAAALLVTISATIILWPTGSAEPAALHIARFEVADPQDRMLANGLRQSLASALRESGLVKVVGLEGLPTAAFNGPRGLIPEVDATLSTRFERTGSKVRLTYSIGDSHEDRGSIALPADELSQLENELVGRVFAALESTRTLAGGRRDRGSDYETFLIANGLTKGRGRRNMQLAEKLLRPIVQRHPEWPEAKLALAKALYLTRNYGRDVSQYGKAPIEAFRLAQEVAKANPTSGRAFALMAVTSPDRRHTLGWLESAVRQEPFDAEILLFLAGAQQKSMQFERAFQTLRQVWELEPYWIRANQLSESAAGLGYIGMANEIDRTLAATHPQRYQRLLARARLQTRAGEWGAALQSAKQALVDPDNPETGEAPEMVQVLSAALGRPTGLEPRNPAVAIRDSLYRGILPDRSTLERDGVPAKNFWGLNRVLLISPALFVAAGREAELVRLFDRSFANPSEMLQHMQVHTFAGPSIYSSVAPYLALSLRKLGRHEEGRRILELARAMLYDSKANGRVPSWLLVDLARIEAVLGNRRAALDQLRQARSQGWPQVGHGPLPMVLLTLRDDPALRSLAGAPDFEAAERQLAELKRG